MKTTLKIIAIVVALFAQSAYAQDAADAFSKQCKMEGKMAVAGFSAFKSHADLDVMIDNMLKKNKRSSERARLGFERATLFGYSQGIYSSLTDKDISKQAYINCFNKLMGV